MKYRVFFHCCPHGIWRHCSEVVDAPSPEAAMERVMGMSFPVMVSFASINAEPFNEPDLTYKLTS